MAIVPANVNFGICKYTHRIHIVTSKICVASGCTIEAWDVGAGKQLFLSVCVLFFVRGRIRRGTRSFSSGKILIRRM